MCSVIVGTQPNTRRRRTVMRCSSPWTATMIGSMMVIAWSLCCCSRWRAANAFSMLSMSATSVPSSDKKFSSSSSYQPPVKTSVEQIQKIKAAGAIRSTAQSALSGAAALSMPSGMGVTQQRRSTGPIVSFEQRMRDLVLGPATSSTGNTVKKERPIPQTTSQLPPNVQRIESLRDYKRVVGDERNKIVAVRFYANYCKACQAVAPHFYHLANTFPHVLFVDVPVSERNTALHQGLGIPTLPFAHIYHPMGGLVEELKLTRNHVSSFKEKLSTYVQGSCEISPSMDDVHP